MKDKQKLKKITFIIFIVSMLLISLMTIPVFMNFNDSKKLSEFINNFGVWGFVILLILQIMQVVVAFIPGEIIEFVSGALYGAFGGFFVCIAGVIIGEWIIWKIITVWGSDVVKELAGKKNFEKFKFLKNKKKMGYFTFLWYFIPGTPKDIATYFIPLTEMKLSDFLIISSIARIPSIISSTFAGDTFIEGNIKKTVIIYIIIAVTSIIGMIAYNKWEGRNGRNNKGNS